MEMGKAEDRGGAPTGGCGRQAVACSSAAHKLTRHDRASELDLWDCRDALVDAEEFGQAMAE